MKSKITERLVIEMINKAFLLLEKRDYWNKKLEDVMKHIAPDTRLGILFSDLDEYIIKMIGFFLKDNENWIEWWYWDCQNGKIKDMDVTVSGKTYTIKSLKDLFKYKLISIDHLK